MWAFGVLFYFMLNMEFPFRKKVSNIRYKSSCLNITKKIITHKAGDQLFICLASKKIEEKNYGELHS